MRPRMSKEEPSKSESLEMNTQCFESLQMDDMVEDFPEGVWGKLVS